MNNKAEVKIGTIILISLLVIVALGVIIFFLILINQKIPENHIENPLNLYIKSVDNKSGYQLTGKFYVTNNQTLIATGDLDSNNLIEVKGINYTSVKVYCQTDGYYTAKEIKNFSLVEINLNASKIICKADKYGDLKINSNSDIISQEGRITLNVSSDKLFKNISGVIKWNSGIIDVKYKNQKSIQTPNRFKNNVDYSFNTSKSVFDSYTLLTFDYKAIKDRNSDDCLTITLFDNDYYLVNGHEYISSEYNLNLGNPKDFSKTFCYG